MLLNRGSNQFRERIGEAIRCVWFIGDEFSYSIDYGHHRRQYCLVHDPEIKREVIWHAATTWHDRRAMVDRRSNVVRVRDDAGKWSLVERNLPKYDSMLSRLVDPARAPEVVQVRESIRSWRFYDQFRTDTGSPARSAQVGTLTPVLSNDGHDLAAAWQTIREIGDAHSLEQSLIDAFPSSRIEVIDREGRLHLEFMQEGLLRPLKQAELSDGTLRYCFGWRRFSPHVHLSLWFSMNQKIACIPRFCPHLHA